MPSILQRGGRPSQGSKSRRAHLGVATTSRSGMTTCGCGRCGTPPDVIADFSSRLFRPPVEAQRRLDDQAARPGKAIAVLVGDA